MADFSLYDRVKETTTTTSTGTITLAGAVDGYQSFSVVGNATKCFYCIEAVDGNGVPTGEWEVGAGTYTVSGTTLSRDTILASSNSGAVVNLSAGTKNVYLTVPGSIFRDMMSRGVQWGLELSNNGTDATNDIDIAVGVASDVTAGRYLQLSSALTKRLDAAWAVGTGNGGLDTGTIANTTYHIWLIRRSDTGVVDALFSTSASSPTMPAGYDQKCRIGSILRAAGAIRAFFQVGDYFYLKTPVLDVDLTDPGTAASGITLTVPAGIDILAITNIEVTANGVSAIAVYLSSNSAVDMAPSLSAAPLGQVYAPTTQAAEASVMVHYNTGCRIRASASAVSDRLRVVSLGWLDLERRG